MCLVPRLERDAGHGLIGEGKPVCSSFKAKTPYVALDRLAYHSTEDAMEMVRREMGGGCQLVEAKGFIQVVLNVH